MADTVTVKRNWKKKIASICEGVTAFTSYSLSNDFTGVVVEVEDMKSFIANELETMFRASLTYNKKTGACCLHIHSNLWYEWTNKIDW